MDVPLVAVAPVTPLCTTVQEKVAPETFELKAMLDVAPLHIVCDEGVAMAVGIGLTVITTSTTDPGQSLIQGVT